MKTVIVYISVHHHNTEKVAKAMADYARAETITLNETDQPINLKDYDLIGLGSGIFYAKHHEKLMAFVTNNSFKNKNVFVFSTSGLGKLKYHKPLLTELNKQGANIIDEFASKGFDTNGFLKWFGGIAKHRPNELDLVNARQFIKAVLSNNS